MSAASQLQLEWLSIVWRFLWNCSLQKNTIQCNAMEWKFCRISDILQLRVYIHHSTHLKWTNHIERPESAMVEIQHQINGGKLCCHQWNTMIRATQSVCSSGLKDFHQINWRKVHVLHANLIKIAIHSLDHCSVQTLAICRWHSVCVCAIIPSSFAIW